MSGSCVTDDLQLKLRELESVMFGPDSDDLDSYNNTFKAGGNFLWPEMDGWRQTMAAISCKDLTQVLIACAKAVADKLGIPLLRVDFVQESNDKRLKLLESELKKLAKSS